MYIAPEHFVIGVLAGESAVADTLIKLGLSHDAAVEATRARLADYKVDAREIFFTVRAKRAMQLAFEEAREHKHSLRNEHLLLGVAREETGEDGLLKSFGVSYEALRAALADAIDALRDVPFERVDHVQLAMPRGEEDRARAFYADLLGMEELRKPAELIGRGGVWFQSGPVQIHLGVEDDFRPARKAHPALQCRDFKHLVQTLREHGIEVQEVGRFEDNRPHAYLFDPFGNRLELIG